MSKANGGKATAQKMTAEERKARAMKGVEARKRKANMPKVAYKGEIKIGDVIMPCFVLDNEKRVLSGRGLQDALKLVDEAPHAKKAGSRLPRLFNNKSLQPFLYKGLEMDHYTPIECYDGAKKIHGYEATILPDICDAVLEARLHGKTDTPRMSIIADQCEVLVRAFARVGITALVDEATGYQNAREKNALAKIFEKFVAKELQPWIKTFPDEYYKQLFRLYGYDYPNPNKKNFRPQFFGNVTNKVVYKKLAPELLPELKKQSKKLGSKNARLHQTLTKDLGHPKLREHLGSIVTLMKLSKNKDEFFKMVDQVHPDFNENYTFDFKE